jgi:SAM-dependent methyltransferase
MTTPTSPDQFYTGLIAQAYAPLRGDPAPAAPYERFVRKWGEPALEIGCGHGEPLLDLVRAGLDVTGLDSSADMLALARAEANRRGLVVDLFCQRMEELDLSRIFASIYFAGPTFQLVIDDSAAAITLERIAQHLMPDGRVLIPLFVPLPIAPEAIGEWREHVTEAGEVLAFQTASQSYRPEERRVDSTLLYRKGPSDQPIEIVERIWSLRWYEDGEFEHLASAGDLVVDRVLDHGATGHSFILQHSQRGS